MGEEKGARDPAVEDGHLKLGMETMEQIIGRQIHG
jgi:hypothetical protein